MEMDLVSSFKALGRFSCDRIATTANFAKKATGATGALVVSVLAADSYHHVFKTDSQWNRLNPCGQIFPTAANIAIIFENTKEINCTRLGERASGISEIFANQLFLLPLVAVSCVAVVYNLHKLELKARAYSAALS
jgi:hypothetical protein